jgi:hypothetical protein
MRQNETLTGACSTLFGLDSGPSMVDILNVSQQYQSIAWLLLA